ncbi:MAG: 2-oxoacid:acceptor oxidoreductase family protein [Firmicutes bacterium]|jgi:2-oxoglutarate ferredoxin oxidoreductase subunit gamma|nr:2-oxoacid:acceptor oxidoreductase family protein [Bacillota bacterium]
MKRTEIRLAGEGGQGLILAGIILAEAAAVYDGANAVQTQSYGPESRGGASKAEVIISEDEIDYPKVNRPDILLVMSQLAHDKYIGDLRPGGTLIADTSNVTPRAPEGARVFELPLTDISVNTTGRAIAANIVALGALVAATGVVSKDAIEKAVAARVPAGTVEVNLRALNAGMEVVRRPATGSGDAH